MSRMSPKRMYRSDLFSPEKLTSTDALERALQELQCILTKDNFKHVFQEILDDASPNILLLVLSSLSKTISLIPWFLESFPVEAADYDATIHCKTISCLSTELLSSSVVEDKELCARHHEIAQITPKVLRYLLSSIYPIDIGSEHHDRKGKAEQMVPLQEENTRTLVRKYFDVDMPETSSEASVLVDHVLQSQKESLKFYLELLCRPGVFISLKERCVTSAFPIEDVKNSLGFVAEPFAHPTVQQMKSAFYIDTTEGFGQWTVIVSSDTENFLRSTYEKDISTFNVAVKKIKELSCGLFTRNNQKGLSGRATEVPIFEAKVSRNLRLVYQIDIIRGDCSEQQEVLEAIKIFGIYTRNQIDNRLWRSMSDQLRQKGVEYWKRCMIRKRADQASKDTFVPVSFPPRREVLPSETENLLDLHPDETAQIHPRLVVEKFFTFSQGRREEAIELLLCEGESKDALRRAQECILEGLWHGISFGLDSHTIRSDPTLSRLMHFAIRLDVTFMNQIKATELSMFIAISQDQTSRLRELGLEFHKIGHSSAALLCLDQYFSRTLQIQSMALVDAIEELDLFYIYVNLLSAAVYQTDPCEDIATATLFGFQWMADNKFLVPRNTWLHIAALELQLRSATSNSDLILSASELRGLFCCVLVDHIKQRINAENDECARSQAFQPCLVFAVSGFCTQPNCPGAHVSPSVIDAGYYNMRIRLHLQQILILQVLRENVHIDMEFRGTKFWIHRLCNALHPPHHMFGSSSHLALSTVPEATKGLNIVKDWMRTFVYRQEFLPDIAFLTDVIRTTTLAFMFDRSEADDYLKHAAYFSMRTPPMYIRRGGSSILPELLAAMSGTYTWSLTAGFVFVEQVLHVIMRQLPIDVGVLCDLVDFLCSSVIFCGRRPGMALLHDITVPRSWLLRFIEYDLSYLNPSMQTNAYHLLLMCMGDLLEQLNGGKGSEYLLYGTSGNLSNVPAVVRHVFIARILKAICLLGYNIHNDLIKNKIRNLLLSLRYEGCMLPSLYSRYVDAASNSWDELAEAIRCSLQHDTMDEMIRLLHKSKAPARGRTLPGVREVAYDNLMDIRELLDPIPIQDTTQSESEQIAAVFIQRIYRKVLRHRRDVSKIGTASLHARIYASCTKEVSQLGDKPGRYLRLFLGPLPHVLICLETIRLDTLSERQRTKKRLKKCSPNETDVLNDWLMQIKKVYRTAINLQKQLSPSSVFHERCDDKQLRKLVEEVNDLVSSLPFDTSSDLSNDLQLAIKGIVVEHSQAHA
ncbi:hypothetical protein EDD18DRAFT_1455776 [Armillaria luteobubalina]|uniref:C3H1-type domain-containing protein n=1 Tax=Armillaria luteobubalina TaxID=153913 RepID=A0AA39V5G2_9AGAR|nr:hypothetical protein EDD18DRAFT_1455776 [Armillaria luteobubalina]